MHGIYGTNGVLKNLFSSPYKLFVFVDELPNGIDGHWCDIFLAINADIMPTIDPAI